MLSIIISGRNDDYDLCFKTSLFNSITYNSKWLQTYKIEHEFIFVEWNPVENTQLLSDQLIRRYPLIKCYVVDPDLQRMISENKNILFFQFFAKNIGARRSSGDLILFTNADILFGNKVLSFLASNSCRKTELCVCDRVDLLNGPAIFNQLNLSENNIEDTECRIRINSAVSLGTTAGDFTLCSRDLLNQIKGYDEKIRFTSIGQDGRLLYYAYRALRSEIHLIDRVYHFDHPNSYSNFRSHDLFSPWGPPWACNLKLDEYDNGPDWGFVNLLDENKINENVIRLELKQPYKEFARNRKIPDPVVPPGFLP